MKKRAVIRNVVYCWRAHLGEYKETAQIFRSSCLGNASPLLWRIPILLWSVAVAAASVATFWGPRELFPLYMTHWGLMLIIMESFFGILVTVKRPVEATPDATFGLPWYVKTYWVLYNITIPAALLITAFYWGVLRTSGKILNYAPNPVIDIMLHGVNSVVMLVELVCSAHPSRLLHIMQPLYFALAYLLFTVAYYYGGGVDPWGNPFIYPVLDWSKPDQTMVVVALTGVFLALAHLLVVGLAALRDLIARRCRARCSGAACGASGGGGGVYNDGFDA